MGRAFGAHWLANLAVLQAGEGQKLKETVKIAADAGCTLFELACSPLNGLSAEEAAAAVLAGGIQEASYCRFFPGDESCGDPLGVVNGGQLKKALKTFEADVEYVRALCQHGLVVKFITGPSCFVLAKEYPLLNGAARFDRMQCFVERQADLVKGLDITICLEYLRSSEDKAIGGYGQMQKLIDAVCREEIGYHADVFHMLELNEEPNYVLRMMGKRTRYLHAHGTDRLPPGAYRLGAEWAVDEANWYLINCALDEVGYHGPVVPEPFGDPIRELDKDLGKGLPAALGMADYYARAHAHLTHMGLI